ncbi:hypothetical protein JW796_04465 [Candidatus Dojkabacteria bacterium]|nr:hypothetical protein [Candidatus Dojkabacteria bacterium]
MKKLIKIPLIAFCILCTGFLVWAGYYAYKYKKNTEEIEESLFALPSQSSNSIAWDSFVTIQNARLVNEASSVDIYANLPDNQNEKIYSLSKSNDIRLEGAEYDRTCEVVRVIKSSTNPDLIIINEDECR